MNLNTSNSMRLKELGSASFPPALQLGRATLCLRSKVEKVVQELRGRGVIFENYDLPNLKTLDGIATIEGFKAAWFKDSEGNVLAIAQRT
jgi:hypothetical protein